MARVRLERLRCAFHRDRPAVDDFSLTLEAGEFFCLLGPSGCGKSTLLRLIGGYHPPDAGQVWIGEQEVTHLPPEKRQAGMVFQNYALFPHLSALENVAFGLRVKGIGKATRTARANEMLDWVGLTPPERSRPPAQLSGGQQQRVALARALANEPALLMLDEPFANLDRILRERLREETKQIQRRTATTTILVTHDRDEAFALADRIGVMRRGRLLQVGTPQEVHAQPVNAFVADFLGHHNLYRITGVEADTIIAGGTRFPLHGQTAQAGEYVLLRSQGLRWKNEPGAGALPGTLRQARFAGGHRVLSIELEGGAVIETLEYNPGVATNPGTTLWLQIEPEAILIVPGEESP